MMPTRDGLQIERQTEREWETVLRTNGKKQTGVAILVSDKAGFKTRAAARDKKGISQQ